ncbi:MAG: hypothetical protein R3247_06700 [Rhodothermales bacterium]|nr:hypothetical protein [Rhodothermales bacterium]
MPFGETEEGEHFFTLPAGGSGAGKPPKVGSGDTVFLCVAGGVVGRARLSRAGYGKMTCAKTGRTVRGFHLVWKPEDVTSFMDRKRLPAAIGRISSAYGWAPVERGTVDGTPGASRAAEAAPRRSVAIKYL